jgi:ABC-type transport system involved in multi-copper enzyme maturation permease subunit
MLTIAHLTLVEARRRKIVVAALICGAVFLAVFGTGMFFVARNLAAQHAAFVQRQIVLGLLSVAGCYAANFLTALFALLLPVDALSGEIDSGVVQTIASKPVRRADIVVGKWLGFGVLIGAYAVALIGGVFVVSRAMSGYVPAELPRVLLLVLAEVTLLLTVSIAGGTRLSTVTNGVVAVGFFGIGFMAGWVENIGAIAGLHTARNIGIAVSLVSPADSLWRLGAYYLQPQMIRDLAGASPFFTASVPSALMVWWALGMTVLVLAWAVRSFSHRPL